VGLLTETIFNRLLDQQKDGATRRGLLQIIADDGEEIISTLADIATKSWKDTAEGWWLDRVGEIIGMGRPPGEEADNIFTVTEAGDTTPDVLHGWGEVGEPTTGGFVWDLFGISTGVPSTDTVYRTFIEAKIAATNSDASIPGLARFVMNAFGLSCTVTRTGTRQVTITLPGTGFDLREFRYLKKLCPAVAGVDVVWAGWPEV
jgi:hypothetical protein